MNAFARRLYHFPAAVLLLLAGCAAAGAVDESASRVSVTFIEPEKFTDARCAEMDPRSTGILGELQKFIIATGAPYVPENMKLSIRVTDINLVGDFELFRGPQADQVRITKGLYPPRIMLEFAVIDGTAAVVRSGKHDLTDLNYQLRNVYPREDYLRYEKDILRDWLRAEFGDLKSRTIG
jgi:Protein of unknown function (DUF3016)